jgi:hypothetical protein
MSVPATLIEALVEWADAQPSMLNWFPGGFYQGIAPTGTDTVLPYMTFVQTDNRPTNIMGRSSRVEHVEVTLEARADNAKDAGRIGQQARDLLLNAAPLSYSTGAESGRYLGGETGEIEDGMGPDGSDVWVHRIPMTFICGSWGTNG